MAKPILSYEFFPPRSDAQTRRFWRTLGCLETLTPDFVSMTYGALGSASQASLDVVSTLQKDCAVPVAAHLTCGGATRDAMISTIDTLQNAGVSRIVALRGDAPVAGTGSDVMHHATDLVALLAERGGFDISVAAYPEIHPEAESAASDMQVLRTKFELGASRALTQFFFEPDVFLRWRDACSKSGIDGPLIPGILPVHDIDKVVEFSGKCGATVPPALIARFSKASTDTAKRALAIEHAAEMCGTLQREGINEFHIYTLNQSAIAYGLSQALLGESASRAAA